MFEVGRVCIKIAGRDAGRKCVVVEKVDDTFVVVDGDVRRKKVNIKHLEASGQTLKLKSGASHSEVEAEFKKLGLSTWSTKPKKVLSKPKKQRKVKEKPEEKSKKKAEEKKEAPAEVKKEAPAEEKKDSSVKEKKEEAPKKEEASQSKDE